MAKKVEIDVILAIESIMLPPEEVNLSHIVDAILA